MDNLLADMENFAAKNHVPIINERGRRTFIEIVRQTKPQKVLEIGTAIGYSTLLIAANAAENVKITTLELNANRYDEAKKYIARSPYAKNIKQYLGEAGKLLVDLQANNEKFDFVFIDAAKGQYLDYFTKIQPMLTADAVILADNVLFRGYVRSKEKPPRRYKTIVKRLREYIEVVTALPFSTEILENGDGLAVTRRIS